MKTNKQINDLFSNRIKNSKCVICGKDYKEKTKIFHQEFGEVYVCMRHMKDKIE